MGELMGKTSILEIEKLLQEPTAQQVGFFTSNKFFINNILFQWRTNKHHFSIIILTGGCKYLQSQRSKMKQRMGGLLDTYSVELLPLESLVCLIRVEQGLKRPWMSLDLSV